MDIQIEHMAKAIVAGAERAKENTDSREYFLKYFYGWCMEVFDKSLEGEIKETLIERMENAKVW